MTKAYHDAKKQVIYRTDCRYHSLHSHVVKGFYKKIHTTTLIEITAFHSLLSQKNYYLQYQAL